MNGEPYSGTVMVMDDEKAIRKLNAEILRRQGYEVITCASGFDAIDYFGSHRRPVDLLVTDVEMPGITGPEAVARIRRIRSSLRVLFVSGSSSEELSRHDLHGSPLLRKPYSLHALAETVRALIKEQTSQRKETDDERHE